MKSGEHSLSFGALYGGGRATGVCTTEPLLLRTNMSSGAMRSFWTPEGAMTIWSPSAYTLIPPPVPDTHPCRCRDRKLRLMSCS
jgi:hypothetical protein